MNHTPAFHALKRLHADIGGQIKANRKEAARLAEDMRHIEAVLRMLEPGFNVASIAARRRNRENPYFERGQIFRHVLGILREAPAPMTTREIVIALLRSRGAGEPSTAAIRTMFGAVATSLRNHRGKTVESIGEGKPVRWRLIEECAFSQNDHT